MFKSSFESLKRGDLAKAYGSVLLCLISATLVKLPIWIFIWRHKENTREGTARSITKEGRGCTVTRKGFHGYFILWIVSDMFFCLATEGQYVMVKTNGIYCNRWSRKSRFITSPKWYGSWPSPQASSSCQGPLSMEVWWVALAWNSWESWIWPACCRGFFERGWRPFSPPFYGNLVLMSWVGKHLFASFFYHYWFCGV